MSNLIVETALQFWTTGRKTKVTSGGWISGNAVCCHHRGEKPDKRSRGGLLINQDKGSFSWHCFNCGFKAGWQPGKNISGHTKSLLRWLNIPESEINKLVLESLKEKDKIPQVKTIKTYDLKEEPLPDECRSFVDLANDNCDNKNFIACIEYVLGRGLKIEDYNWHWSSASGYQDRVIIPFYHQNKIVGWTGRRITDGKIKYLSKTQPGYLFNIDAQTVDKSFVIVVEGQFDAISIGGVATMQNEVSEGQIIRINGLNREVIIVPDRDAAGAKMIQAALNNGWNVSIPPWDENIKDVNDAVEHYGKIYTLASILHYKETNKVKIEIAKKKLEKKLDSQN